MTRFARAKGSKASNEKAPEDSTPWEVMKEQLLQTKKESEEAKKRQEAENQRIENYENFLKERRIQKMPATWCDFPEAEKKDLHGNIDAAEVNKKLKKKKWKGTAEHPDTKNNSQTVVHVIDEDQLNDNKSIKPNKKKKNKKRNLENVDNPITTPNDTRQFNEGQSNGLEPAKKKRKKNKNKQKGEIAENQPQDIGSPSREGKSLKKKKDKKKNKTAQKNLDNDLHEIQDPLDSSQGNNIKKQKDKNKSNSNKAAANNENSSQQFGNASNKIKKAKKKLVDGQPVRRKEINDRSFQLVINGKEVELVRFDGFPVMKKDAERLAELKNSMIKKGIPKSEVQRTMKLERRRAEKALARLKREVCYNCRKGGHNLSDCPELKSKIPGADAAEGVCFKCGSTEHRQFECKVQRDKEFRFATCFICKEPGHIARQCPDNPKGLYPNGGSCKLCGDVTHLRKDCPTANNKKEETSVKLQTLASTENIEDIGIQNKASTTSDSIKKPKKIRF